jgi:hypothetical protein
VAFLEPVWRIAGNQLRQQKSAGQRLVKGTENLLFLLLGVATRLWIENLMHPTIFAAILLRAAGAVTVFDDVRGAAFPPARRSL